MSDDDVNVISVILFKIGGLLSMIGSFFILRDVWMKLKEKKDISLTATLVCELSIFDFFSSFFGPFLGTWMVPKETGAYLAAGTTASCTAQGLITTVFYTSSVICNASLAIAYCLIVKKGRKDDQSNNIGNWLLHGFPLVSPIVSLAPIFDNAFNFDGVALCSIKSYPLGCELDGSGVECTRGLHEVYFKFTSFSILFVVNIIIIVSILMLIHSVWVIEKKTNHYARRGNINQSNSLKTTWQGICYIAAFVMAWWPFAIRNLTQIFTPDDIPTLLQLLYVITWPAQGAYNAIVYFRPKYKSDRERHRSDTRLRSIHRVLHLSEFGISLPKNRTMDLAENGNLPKPSAKDSDNNDIVRNNENHVMGLNMESALDGNKVVAV